MRLFVYLTLGLLLLISIGLLGCQRQEETKPKTPVNYFSMHVNGQLWTPYQDPIDPCRSTYSGQYTELQYSSGEIKPFYRFVAYRDSTGRADVYSDTYLRMQVMNVTKPDAYILNGFYGEDFDSFITFKVEQPDGSFKRYTNNARRIPMVVYVDEISFMKNVSIPSIKGTFSGVIYNETNPSDSLIIEQGRYNFKYMGGFHCGF